MIKYNTFSNPQSGFYRYPIFVFILLFSFFVTIPRVHAETAYAESGCSFEDWFLKIEETQKDFSITGFERVKKEIVLRSDLLKYIINCAISDSEKLQSGLLSLSALNSDAVKVRNNLVYGLDQSIAYYESQAQKVDGLGLQSSKDFAKSILGWREENFFPLSQKAGNFIVWGSNQVLFDGAEKRLGQMDKIINTFKLIDNENIKKSLEEAKSSFGEAKDLNNKALQSFISGDFSPENLPNVRGSLESLSKTYEIFFSMGKAIKKVFPIAF